MQQLSAVILAAGKGTRMPGDLPKVAHEVAGAPMVHWVVDACRQAGCAKLVIVVGYKQEVVRAIFAEDKGLEFAVQAEQLGTGHAVASAASALRDFEGDVLTLAGDGPLVTHETLSRLAHLHRSKGAVCTMATSTLEDPTGYGRIVRGANGRFQRIVEEKNATPEQKAIREVYPSICVFRARELFDALRRLPRDSVTGEYYITHVPEMLSSEGGVVELLPGVAPEEAMGVNTPAQLEMVDRVLRQRTDAGEMGSGRAIA